MKKIKYSICSTSYNVASRVRRSLDSIINLIENPEEFEIVVVDSKSTDGTTDILKEYKTMFPNFKLIEKKCKRGEGWRLAFNNSSGKYIIWIALDTIYLPQWKEFLKAYESWNEHDKFVVRLNFFGVAPRYLIQKAEGWKNLQSHEGFQMWYNLSKMGAFKWSPLVVGKNWEIKEPERRYATNLVKIVWRKFITEKDMYIGRGGYPLYKRLKEIRSWKVSKKNYYLFWIPLTLSAKLISSVSVDNRLPPNANEIIWSEKNKIDFPWIKGERSYVIR